MLPSSIPPEHDADLILWRAQSVSLRDIAARLAERGVKVSHLAVSRRLRAIQRAQSPVALEHEALQSLSLNLDDLDEVESRLRHIEELAAKGSRKHGLPPNLALAYRAVSRRGELILSKHRLLQVALSSGLGQPAAPSA